MIGAGLVLAFAGAFGTGDILRPVPLGLYWVGIVCVTYLSGSLVSALLRPMLAGLARIPRVVLLGLATGLALTLVIFVINTALFGTFLNSAGEVLRFATPVFGVSFIVTLVLDYAFSQFTASPAATTGPSLLDRLPYEKRGPLVALSVEDHYVRVRTTKGEDMLLMRLGDAIKETAPTPGLQVHRSHWVALSEVTSAKRDGAKAILTMSHGDAIPVSRANVAAVKEAGLLPG